MAYTLADAYLMRLRVDPTQLRKDVDRAASGTHGAGRRAGELFARGFTVAVGAAVSIGIASVTSAMKFNKAMLLIRTQAGGTAKDVRVLSEQVLKLGMYSEQGPQKLAEALYHLKSVGMDNVSAMKALRAASDLAAVGGADLEQTTNALAGAWRSGIKGAQNFAQATATLNAIVGAGNMRMGDLVDAISSGILPAARTFGLTFKSVGASLAVLTDVGMPAAEAATRLRMSIALLGAPSAIAEQRLRSIGLTGLKLANAMRSPGGLYAALTLLKNHLDDSGLSASRQAQLLSQAFGGGRSSAAILALLGNLETLRQKQEQINAATSKYGQAVAAQRATVGATWARLRSVIEVIEIRLGTKLLPQLVKLGQWLLNTGIPAMEKFWRQAAGPAVASMAGIAKSILVPVFNALRNNPGLVKGLLALAAVGAAGKAIGGVFGAMKTGWGSITKVLGWLTGGAIGGGMQTAADTMLTASGAMQRAADTMVGAGWTKGWPRATGPGAPVPLPGRRGPGPVTGLPALFTSPTFVAGLGAAIGLAINWVSTNLAPKGTQRGRAAAGIQQWAYGQGQTTTGGIAGILAALGLGGIGTSRPSTGRPSGTAYKQFLGGPLVDWAATKQGVAALTLLNTAFKTTRKSADVARAAVKDYGLAVSISGRDSALSRPARVTLLKDLEKAGVDAKTARKDVDRYTDAIVHHGYSSDQARAARRRMIKDIEDAFMDSRQGRRDMDRLTTAIRQHGTTSDAYKTARRRLIQDLKDAGIDAKTARRLVDTFTGAIKNIPGRHKTIILVTGSGSYTVKQIGKAYATHLQGPGGHGGPLARGGLITVGTTATADDVLARVSRGELVVPAHLVRAGAVDHLKGRIPGFATGGVAGAYATVGGGLRSTQNEMTAQVLTATRAAVKAALAAATAAMQATRGGYGSYGVKPSGALQAYAMALLKARGWGGQWGAFNSLVMGESGWNVHATNPSSGAYGIPQALPASKMASAGADWATSGYTQLRWMMGYLAQIYGSPARAWAMWQSRSPHWYGQGGRIPEPIMGMGLRSGTAYGFHAGEQVSPQGDMKALTAAVQSMHRDLARLLEKAPARTAAGLGEALNRSGRRAAYSGMYGG